MLFFSHDIYVNVPLSKSQENTYISTTTKMHHYKCKKKMKMKKSSQQQNDSFEKAVECKGSLPLHFVVIKLQALSSALCRCNFSNNKAYNRVSVEPSNIQIEN